MSAQPPGPASTPTPDSPPSTFWRIFGTPAYFRLWCAQVISSLGDWIGILAILAIAARVSSDSGTAVSFVMMARVVPGFFLATLGGVIVDRFDRRKVMVSCDVGRASLLMLLPFIDTVWGLVLVSFLLEILTLLWGPAKDASMPNIVGKDQLASANSLSLFASFGTFPIGAALFAALTGLAKLLGNVPSMASLTVNQEVLALWVDAGTYLLSALLVFRLPFGGRATGATREGGRPSRRVDFAGTFRELAEGVRFLATHRTVRGVIVGLGFGILGGGAMIPLGPVFARQALGGDQGSTFGILMSALGSGAAVGVMSLMALQGRVRGSTVFSLAVIGMGTALIAAASFSALAPAALMVVIVGAFAGTGYVSGFTLLQEVVSDDLRGRTFATLYTVVRLCLLLSLTVSPLAADLFDTIVGNLTTGHKVEIGGFSYALPGVRLALWFGGLVAVLAGIFSWRELRRDRKSAYDRFPHSPMGTLR